MPCPGGGPFCQKRGVRRPASGRAVPAGRGAPVSQARELSLRPNEEERKELLRWASGGTSIVAGTLNATVYPEQLALLEAMAKLAPPMACVALRGPFELELLPDSVFRIPVYEYSRRGIRQVCRYLER